MFDTAYMFLWSSTGFSLMVVGLGFLLGSERQRVRIACGTFYITVGATILFSWISEFVLLPLPVDNFLVIVFIFVISQSIFEMNLFLYGDEARRGTRRTVYIVGVIWSLLLWTMPFLDGLLGLPVLRISIEDHRPMAIFQCITFVGCYVWPIAIAVISLRSGKWRPFNLPFDSGITRSMLAGMAWLVGVLLLIGGSMIAGNKVFYRIGQLALQALMLASYFFLQARPDAFVRARKEIAQHNKRQAHLEPAEAADIGDRLGELVTTGQVFVDPGLDLAAFARMLNLPAYRLSAYMNEYRGSSFSEWLNVLRIDHARKLLADGSDDSIQDIARQSGYASKAVFNNQFQRRTGMTPTEYRAKKRRAGKSGKTSR